MAGHCGQRVDEAPLQHAVEEIVWRDVARKEVGLAQQRDIGDAGCALPWSFTELGPYALDLALEATSVFAGDALRVAGEQRDDAGECPAILLQHLHHVEESV